MAVPVYLFALMLVLVACHRRATEPILPNDNRRPAGLLREGALTLDLELRRGRWHPDAADGPSLEVQAFAEGSGPLQIPSPLVRVRQGTELRVRIRNTLVDSTLVMHGLHTRPGAGDDTVMVAPGTTREVRFTAGAPGTYFYWGSTAAQSVAVRDGDDSQLSGAFIVDSLEASAPDRVFLMGLWFRPADTTARPHRPEQEIMTINGKAWPHTERFDLALGDTVQWRWVNPTNSSHPMHLHGFYFQVHSRGDWIRDTAYAAPLRPLVVTELMLPGGTMAIRWAPTRPGNWVFHCHFAFHVSPGASLTGGLAGEQSAGGGVAHDHSAERGMAGLVLGIHVSRNKGAQRSVPVTAPRQLRLLVQSRPRYFGDTTGYGYVLQKDGTVPAPDSIEIPGPTLVLERGRPVRITIVNQLREQTGVHWHGIELESYADGVPGWSGVAPRIMPPIAPGESFVAEFTPPRAGTFIYHSHAHELVQISQGLYGALLVVEPGQPVDPRDRLVIVSLDGPSGNTSGGLVNGSKKPPPIELEAGQRHRLRLININTDARVLFTLLRDTVELEWRALAKDGAELPPAQATRRRASLLTGPGETADFEVGFDRTAPVTLRVSAPYAERPWTIEVPVRIRGRPSGN